MFLNILWADVWYLKSLNLAVASLKTSDGIIFLPGYNKTPHARINKSPEKFVSRKLVNSGSHQQD